jgi:hypothetical protein
MPGYRDTPARGVPWPLVDALHDVSIMSNLRGRHLVIRLIGDELRRPLSVDEHPQTTAHLACIVNACRQVPDGLRALVRVLEHLEPDSLPTVAVRRIVQQMAALESWSPEAQQELFELLAGVVVPDIAEVYRFVGGSAAPALSDTATCEDMVLALDTLNAGPDDLPRLLVFIEHLAARVRVDLAVKLRGWASRQAENLQLLPELRNVRRLLPRTSIPTSPQPRSAAYIIFMFQIEDLGSQLRLSHWRQLDTTGGWYPERGTDRVGTMAELKEHVAAVIEDVEAEWARYVPDIRIEFVLPMALLNLDIDQWQWETQSAFPQPMGCRFPVVVRSLERMQKAAWHRPWYARWEELEGQVYAGGVIAADCGHWNQCADETGLRELAAFFERRSNVVALMPCAAPVDGALDELTICLRAGIPVAVWHRKNRSDEQFVITVKGVLHTSGSGHLLERVKLARLDAYAEAAGQHGGAHMTVLWDDPQRMVVPDRPVPPEEVA